MTNLRALLCAFLLAACLSAGANAEEGQIVPSGQALQTLYLSKVFKTKSNWVVTISQDDRGSADFDGPFHVCFFRDGTNAWCEADYYNGGAELSVVHPRSVSAALLAMKAAYIPGGSGAPVDTAVWTYRADRDTFERIFFHTSNLSDNEETRVVAKGPLAGYIVADTPNPRWPYPYDITVYRLSAARRYAAMLHYRSNTRFGDGNGLAVIDAEMPEIERLLNLRKPDDPLPRPLYLASHCKTPTLRKGAEWCG